MSGPLSASALMEIRDRGARLHAVDRAILLLQIGDEPAADAASLSLAERDRQLLSARAASFGDHMPCLADCPACGTTQEFSLSAQSLLLGLADARLVEQFDLDDVSVTLRALDSRDLAAAALAGTTDDAVALLAGRAVVAVRDRQGETTQQLPESLRGAVETRVEAMAASAEIALDLACQECGGQWTASFDVGQYFWTEIDTSARRMMLDVVALAKRFGWSEADILDMPAARRRAYIDLAGDA